MYPCKRCGGEARRLTQRASHRRCSASADRSVQVSDAATDRRRVCTIIRRNSFPSATQSHDTNACVSVPFYKPLIGKLHGILRIETDVGLP